MTEQKRVLVGNSFPAALIRHPVRIEPKSLGDFRKETAGRKIASFWGHANTLAAAESFCGVALVPHTERPIIELDGNEMPFFDGEQFRECWIISAACSKPARLKVGDELQPQQVHDWRILKMTWKIK